jgi:hypothetical protein
MRITKLADIKPFMYKGRFKTKKLFWEHVLEKQAQREKLRLSLEACKPELNLSKRYAERVEGRYGAIDRAIFQALGGTPAHYYLVFRAGDPKRSCYQGSHTSGYYGGSYRRTAIKEHVFEIYAGLRTRNVMLEADGIMNIKSRLVKTFDSDVRLYSATWCKRSGRSFDFVWVDGWIAEYGHTYYHGHTRKEALSGLRRKLQGKFAGRITADTVIGVKEFMAMTGACKMGCERWLDKEGLAYDTLLRASQVVVLLRASGESGWADKLKSKIYSKLDTWALSELRHRIKNHGG